MSFRIIRLGDGARSELVDNTRAEDEAFRRAAELEVAKLVALVHMAARGDLGVDNT